tara:strand:- start:2232 stop:3467 length:1236 start_codon:yes stop_codon:yes gene_type:complete
MQKVLFIGMVWPEPNATAAGTRILQLIKTFLLGNNEVIFASTAAKSELSYNLELLNITQISIILNDSSFDHFIKELQPDIVVFDRFITEEQFGWRVVENVPNALRILDTEDLHSLRLIRYEANKNKKNFSIDKWVQSDTTKREIASIYRCDFSLIISNFEMQLLVETLKIDGLILLHLPFMVEKIKKEVFKKYPEFEKRKDFICIGNGKHAPNVDAIRWLKDSVWTLIRKQLPESRLHIYGAYLPQQVLEMHHPKQGFYVDGHAENLEQIFTEARINLAPLRFGAGLKGKLIDAMRFGTPSITTTIGAEGMHENLPWNGFIADDENNFVNAAVSYYTHKESWSQAQQNGLEILTKIYDSSFLSKKLLEKIEHIQENKKQHRNSNFIGSLLLHQTVQSTKYMSKWIEAKNSK